MYDISETENKFLCLMSMSPFGGFMINSFVIYTLYITEFVSFRTMFTD